MKHMWVWSVALVALVGCGEGEAAKAEKDPAADLVATIEGIKLPVLNSTGDKDVYQAKYESAWRQRAPLVLKLMAEHPDHAKTAKYMDEYWQSMMTTEMSAADCDRVIKQIDAARASSTNADLRRNAAFWSTFYAAYRDREDIDKVLAHGDAFSLQFPTDARGASIFTFASMSGKATRAQMERALRTLITHYPTTEDGNFAQTMLPLMRNVGKAFEFDFKDAMTGQQHRDEDYRGKVLVIDFWATWCGPCIQSLPRMKETYAKYSGKGVEFIGVSFDPPVAQGGLADLQKFVKENGMSWPQWHLDGDSKVQDEYGVQTLPTIFVVDRAGKIVSIDGYRTLERTLESLVG